MSAGKKFTVVLSIGVVGVSAAMFFWPDAFWHGGADDPFGTHVERRVTSGSASTDRLPAATAAITQPESPNATPAYHRSFRPVGTLLPPIDSVPEEPEGDGVFEVPQVSPAEPLLPGGVTRHTVEDGDTLTQLAVRYLGRADAYWRIYEANRDVLTNPDLLPIGAVLEIPPRSDSPAVSTSRNAESLLPMVPVPSRPPGAS